MDDNKPYFSLFGDRVLLFDPGMDRDRMQATLRSLHAQQAKDEFSERRYALLFKPGEYDLDIAVDYYVHAAGLGQLPGDVRINGTVQSIATTSQNRVTTMFWRAAENFLVCPADAATPVVWAVSQAAPYRRMHVKGDVQFDLGGWASGGFLANSIIEGRAGLTSGQQWITRNAELGSWRGGQWNRTFVGTVGSPTEDWPASPTTVIDRTPVIRDKPFLVIDQSGEFSVFLPALATDTRGVSWGAGEESGTHFPMSDFHIAFPGQDDASSINEALDAGKHLLLTPGIYRLDDAIRVRRPDTIVMGLGLATLVPQTGKAALSTSDADGIVIASVMVDAGPVESPVLIRIGERGADSDHGGNPASLHDVYCRVGGAAPGRAGACVEINSSDVIVDNSWLWRADHGAGAAWDVNTAQHGLVVNGDDVTAYGLFNEHFQQFQTLWNGERGRVFFYQSEAPYDPPDQSQWMNGDCKGYASYKVADHVRSHEARGLGIYSFFGVHQPRDAGVRLTRAVEAPDTAGVRIVHVTTFAGNFGGIDHPVNALGQATNVNEIKLFDGIHVPK